MHIADQVVVGIDGGVRIDLQADLSEFQAVIGPASALADVFPAFRERLQAFVDRGENLLCVHGENLTAGAAGQLTVRVAPSKALIDLLATAGAGDGDGNRADG